MAPGLIVPVLLSNHLRCLFNPPRSAPQKLALGPATPVPASLWVRIVRGPTEAVLWGGGDMVSQRGFFAVRCPVTSSVSFACMQEIN